MDDKLGRAAIIANGSPLFTGNTASGESQIRRWMIESDLIEAIIALPTDLFYNTGIQTYVWILSKNKRPERKGKIQLINAAEIYHKLRKAAGNKKNEIKPEDRKKIAHLYADFVENKYCKIYNNEEFLYKEYTVMQPLQRSYAITEERIEQMLTKGSLSFIYDEGKVFEFENKLEPLTDKEKKKLEEFYKNKPIYDKILETLKSNLNDKIYYKLSDFEPVITKVLKGFDNKIINKVIDGLSEMDKKAEIHKDKKGNIIYDKESKDTEIVKFEEDINTYMAREVLPHIPDTKAFFEGKSETATWDEDNGEKTIKIGAEIPFTRYFYEYKEPTPSKELLAKFQELEKQVREKINGLF